MHNENQYNTIVSTGVSCVCRMSLISFVVTVASCYLVLIFPSVPFIVYSLCLYCLEDCYFTVSIHIQCRTSYLYTSVRDVTKIIVVIGNWPVLFILILILSHKLQLPL